MKSKTMYSMLALCVVAWAGTASAAQAVGPICDTNAVVRSTTYYFCDPARGEHKALDILNNTCGSWNERAMLVGSYYWNVKSSCASACNGSSCGNWSIVVGSNGWNFGQHHMIANANSYSKTCDRCSMGLVGGTGAATAAHTHAENHQNGTLHTGWYTGYVNCGSSGYCGNTMGYPRLS